MEKSRANQLAEPDIELTEAACERIRSVLKAEGKQALRISLSEAGCSGLEYVLDYADLPADDDLVAEHEGFRLFVDADAYQKALIGLKIDFQQDMLSAAFVFHNPNKQGECGCGASFTL
ncbi:MAG: iron-sulfur cluster assembly accessory protein [Mariprofundaceae bacterium]|nr:iron-sulfur cluster assembly accessory protein [Mariprofundaceae bacterium]